MDTLVQDVRCAFRMLWKSPGFTVIVVLTLALGIGANTAIFTVINAVLLSPLPFGQPDRVVSLFETNQALGIARETFSPANFQDVAKQNRVFSSAAAYLRGPKALTGQGEATRLRVVSATPGLFDVLGAAPVQGRGFLSEDAASGHQPVAVRTALGATPLRLIRQLLTESLLLSVMGAMAGLLLAAWAMKAILLYGPRDIPRIHGVQMDGKVLVFSTALAGVTGLIFGLFPALRAARPDLNRSLKSGTRTTGDRDSRWVRSSLVTSELALSLVLLVGAGLLLRSFLHLQSVDPGFNPMNVLTFDLSLPQGGYSDGGKVAVFANDLLQRLRALPGVESAAVVNPRPLSGDDYSSSFTIKGQPANPGDDDRSAQVRIVSPDYFKTLKIPLLRGRVFQGTDRRDSPPVAVLSRHAERKFFATTEALGQQMNFDARIGYDKVGGEIVGIVGDVHDFGLDLAPPPDAYVLQDQAGVGEMSVLVRTHGDPVNLAAAAREQVHAIDNNLPVAVMSTMEAAMGESLAQRRFYMLLLGLFAAIAIALAAVGVYGVMAYSVVRRTQEIGIRLALGAQNRHVLRMVLGHGMRLLFVGVAIGIAAALALTHLMASQLFGVTATDPLTFAGVALLLVAVALFACYLPARRALQIDPMVALRYE